MMITSVFQANKAMWQKYLSSEDPNGRWFQETFTASDYSLQTSLVS